MAILDMGSLVLQLCIQAFYRPLLSCNVFVRVRTPYDCVPLVVQPAEKNNDNENEQLICNTALRRVLVSALSHLLMYIVSLLYLFLGY